MENILFTEKGKSYWNNEGAYQKEFEELDEALVPIQGGAETLVGEVIRAVGRLNYEYYNNGNGNACDVEEIEGDWIECDNCGGTGKIEADDENESSEEIECPDCGGEGGYYMESEYEFSVNPFFENFLELLEDTFSNEGWKDAVKTVDSIRDLIIVSMSSENNILFSDENELKYARLMDYAVAWALKHKDEKIPLPDDYQSK